eukprot:PhF_6_TR35104/c3_g1_i3/m.51172
MSLRHAFLEDDDYEDINAFLLDDDYEDINALEEDDYEDINAFLDDDHDYVPSNPFLEDYERSKVIIEYRCRHCNKKWWGVTGGATCNRCRQAAKEVPFESKDGVAWFKCDCGRTFRSRALGREGFTCPCKGCGEKAVRPLFFLPPTDNSTQSRSAQTHSCSLCHGSGYCPLMSRGR